MLRTFIEKIKELFIKRKFYCVECEKEKKGRYCNYCQKEAGNLFKIVLTDTVKVSESLGIKQKRPGIRKYIKEVLKGFQQSKDQKRHPKGVDKIRIIDRENDRYDETVKDNKNGKIFRDIHEPLSQHIPNSQKRGKKF